MNNIPQITEILIKVQHNMDIYFKIVKIDAVKTMRECRLNSTIISPYLPKP